ncbi:MAG: acyl-CoA thioesterase [Peptococcaceae bacterium]
MHNFNFYYPLRVRYSEIDGQRIVFNSHYLTYVDVAVVEYFRNIFQEHWEFYLQENKFELVLVKANLEYKKPARLDDVLNIYCKVTGLGNSSINIAAQITREKEQEILFTADNIYVCIDLAKGSSRSIPEEIREKITAFEGITK